MGNRRRRFVVPHRLAGIVACWCFGIAIAYAQPAALSGQVVDRDNHGIPDVSVVAILESDSARSATAITDVNGRFRFADLEPGSYRVEFTLAGFSRQVRSDVEVGSGATPSLRIVFRTGARAAPPPPPPPPPPAPSPPPLTAAPPPGAGSPASGGPSPQASAGNATIPVFYATDRERVSGSTLTYGTKRNPAEALQLGRFDVSIPRDHVMGVVERPGVWTLWTEDLAQHFVITKRAQLSYDGFYSGIEDVVGRSERKEAFVFIHGFNVPFEDAVYRTAQLAYDLGFDGAPILYSWPSAASVSPIGYTTDSGNSEWTVPHLRWFLEDVARRSGAQRIHLIAHSMGNKALVHALDRMALSSTRKFSQIVLTAPDIDASVFVQLAGAVRRNAQRATLYASSNKALLASKTLAAYPRAGDASGTVVVVPGIDTVDVSSLATDFLGHSYYGGNDSVLSDLFLLITQGLPPPQRPRLRAAGTAPNQFWRFTR
jgi:esterase/lipase superfamily enzyme